MDSVKKFVFSQINGIIIGITFSILGLFFLINQNILMVPLAILFGLNGIHHLLQSFKGENYGNRFSLWIQTIFYLILSFLFVFFEEKLFEWLGFILFLWVVLNTIIRAMNVYILYAYDRKIDILQLVSFLLHIIFIIVTISFIKFSHFFVIMVSGYSIYYGVNLILSSVLSYLKRKELPTLVAALLPNFVLKYIESHSELIKKNTEKLESEDFVNIYVYLGKSMSDKVGHVDIGYKNNIYTYGAHDPFNRNRFFLWGKGVLAVCSEKEYIDFSLKIHKKKVVQFVYQLSNIEKKMLESRISELMDQTVPFEWVKNSDDFSHYLPLVNNNIGAENGQYYVFKKASIFEYYNVFKINCVLVSYYLLNDFQDGLFNLNGIVTPGSYFHMLLSLYNQEDSPIREMNILKRD